MSDNGLPEREPAKEVAGDAEMHRNCFGFDFGAELLSTLAGRLRNACGFIIY